MLSRRPRFPKEMLTEAARYPGGHVYEIDAGYERDGAIPAYAIIRGWEVNADGKPTGEYVDNPKHGIRSPLSDVEQVIAEATALTRAKPSSFHSLVTAELRLRGTPVSFDVAITVVVDRVLALGYGPREPQWRTESDRGWRYDWVKN